MTCDDVMFEWKGRKQTNRFMKLGQVVYEILLEVGDKHLK